jgi:DNA end-binding protein Ku
MPRAIWNGAISFGLVNVPVKLYNAVSRRDVRFNQLHAPDGSRVQMRRFCALEGVEVPTDEIVRGYEVSKGSYVVISDEELEAARPEGTHQIAIEEFVDLAEIDPVVYDTSYHAAPERVATRAYALLRDAMLDAGRVGIGRFALRTRESVCAVRATENGLVVSTLAYADEVIPADSIPEIGELSVEATEKERAMAVMLIDSMTVPLDLTRHRDTFRDAILEVIQRKAAGETIATPAPVASKEAPVADIMAALEASLAAAKERSAEPAKKPARRSKAASKG